MPWMQSPTCCSVLKQTWQKHPGDCVVQDVCIDLEVADPTSLPAAISKLLRVVATLPRLERFVGDVCEVTAPVP